MMEPSVTTLRSSPSPNFEDIVDTMAKFNAALQHVLLLQRRNEVIN